MLMLSEQVTQEKSASMYRVSRWARHWSHNCRIRDKAFEQLHGPRNCYALPPEIPGDNYAFCPAKCDTSLGVWANLLTHAMY